MKAMIETTGTVDDFRYPEHTYILNEAGKLVGFIREGETDLKEFKKPLAFYQARRTFKKVSYPL